MTYRSLPPCAPVDALIQLLRWGCLVALCAHFFLLAAMPARAYAQTASPIPDRLKVGTRMEFDGHVRTVRQAMEQLLLPVQYHIVTRTIDVTASEAALRRPLPARAVNAGLMSIEDGLLLLIGEEDRLVVDHKHRLVAVEPVRVSTPDAL